jgi:hypothetical protein
MEYTRTLLISLGGDHHPDQHEVIIHNTKHPPPPTPKCAIEEEKIAAKAKENTQVYSSFPPLSSVRYSRRQRLPLLAAAKNPMGGSTFSHVLHDEGAISTITDETGETPGQNRPDLQLVMMASCVNSIQHNGSASTALLCAFGARVSIHPRPLPDSHDIPRQAEESACSRATTQAGETRPRRSPPRRWRRGSSWSGRGSLLYFASRPFGGVMSRRRSFAASPMPAQHTHTQVSTLRDRSCSLRVRARDSCITEHTEHTYRPRTMQHADAKVPQADPAVLADAAEAVVPAVAPPRVKGE